MAITVKVVLPANRNNLGTIELVDSLTGVTTWGPRYCYGRADRGTAAAHGNPTADPQRKYGHTPTGTYNITGLRPVAPAEAVKFGAQSALRIDGVLGEAMVRRANGTTDLLIHGGRPTMGANLLRPTNGCLRLLDLDMQALLAAISAAGAAFPISMTVTAGPPGTVVAGGPDDGYDDAATA